METTVDHEWDLDIGADQAHHVLDHRDVGDLSGTSRVRDPSADPPCPQVGRTSELAHHQLDPEVPIGIGQGQVQRASVVALVTPAGESGGGRIVDLIDSEWFTVAADRERRAVRAEVEGTNDGQQLECDSPGCGPTASDAQLHLGEPRFHLEEVLGNVTRLELSEVGKDPVTDEPGRELPRHMGALDDEVGKRLPALLRGQPCGNPGFDRDRAYDIGCRQGFGKPRGQGNKICIAGVLGVDEEGLCLDDQPRRRRAPVPTQPLGQASCDGRDLTEACDRGSSPAASEDPLQVHT